MRATSFLLTAALLASATSGTCQDKKPGSADAAKVRRSTVKGGLYHSSGDWIRITGKVTVKNGYTIVFENGREVALVTGLELEQMGKVGDDWYPAGREAAEFLRTLIGGQTVTMYVNANSVEYQRGDLTTGRCFVGETNLGIALIRNGWAFARHTSVVATEIMAREDKLGLWQGQFVPPDEWRQGKRLPGEEAARNAWGEKKADGKPPAIVGTWTATAWHTVHASLFQPEHGARNRVTTVRFDQVGDRITGHAAGGPDQEEPMAIPTVRFTDDRLALEFDIVWDRIYAAPIAVQARRLPNKGTLRVEARLTGERLVGQWKIFTADGAEVFRGEWSAVRAHAKK